MATESGDLTRAGGLRWADVRDRLFRSLLVGATLSGILALAALLAVVTRDALQLGGTEPAWFVAFLATFVLPVAGYAAYARRHPPVGAVAGRFVSVLVVTAALAGTVVAVTRALGPEDITLFLYAAALPALAAAAYGRRNPAATWTGPAMPLGVVAGVAVAAAAYGVVRGLLGVVALWILFLAVVAVPAAGVVGWTVAKPLDGDARAAAAGAVVTFGAGVLAAVGGLFLGYDPVLGATLAPTVAVPAGLYAAVVWRRTPEGRAGLLAPAVVVGGLLAGAVVVGRLEVAGPDTWLTVTLLTEAFSTLDPRRAGIYPQLMGSIILVGVMAAAIFPVGVGAAVYLEEYAPQHGAWGRVTQLIQVNISNLAAVPSVVYGLLGLGLFVGFLGLDRGVLIAASVTLGLLILPIVIVTSQEAIRSVPDSHRQASYGMGASRWQTVREVVVPEAFPGILTSTILALGRAIGETAPLLLIGVATTKNTPPGGLFEKATALPLQIFASRSLPQAEYRYGVLAAAVVVLVALMLAMNGAAIVLRNRYQRG